MAVIYICDRCEARTEPDALTQAELTLPPEPDIALDLCRECAAAVRDHLVGASARTTVTLNS